MNLYIDCEWNSWGGDLISMALVPADKGATEFYEVIGCDAPHTWVLANVIPHLEKSAIGIHAFRASLGRYLNEMDDWHGGLLIIADWPEDIAYFCNATITGAGERIPLPPLNFAYRHFPDTHSKVPHNALWDARANRDYGESVGWF